MKISNLDQERIDRYFSGSYSKENAFYVRDIFIDNSKERTLKYFLSKQFGKFSPDYELQIVSEIIRWTGSEDYLCKKLNKKSLT